MSYMIIIATSVRVNLLGKPEVILLPTITLDLQVIISYKEIF